MKIQYCSDIHVDRSKNHAELKNRIQRIDDADVLVIAGDIADGAYHGERIPDAQRARTSRAGWALKYFKENWPVVVHCWGNHDFYYGSFPANYFGHTHDVGNIRFISSPLFSQIENELDRIYEDTNTSKFVDMMMIESPYGGRIKALDYNAYAQNCLDFIEKELKELPEGFSAVMVTHHLPLWECISEQYRGERMNYFYANNLTNLIEANAHKIKVWFHGHSHQYQRLDVFGVPIIRNPLGYLGYTEGISYVNRIFEL